MKDISQRKQLYMIGNSHIDPVWFWTWKEGMQEVKSTYASVLDRMKEFPDFKFTSTSTAFFEWIEKIAPEMFVEIKQRIAEGRWEITGGWFVEPDCLLPNGESFVRQGLYSQRYLQSRFSKTCRIGSNIDSFGHNPNLPQILSKSGMDAYIFMRPRLDTPVFRWSSLDGSSITAISLPGEYTTWFYEPTKQNIQSTLDKTAAYDKMVCFYGVGNHGGGPTIENIRSIHNLQNEFPDTDLELSTITKFLKDIQDWRLPACNGAFEKINVGCYSIDSAFKHLNRLAEKQLMEADALMAMGAARTGTWIQETDKMEALWKTLLFNQFHDTLGGTLIKEARDEAVMQLSGVCATASYIKALAMQHIANSVDTSGFGFPLFLFHTGSQDFDGVVEVELNWFCKSPLMLINPNGEEIQYQQIHTEAKMRNYNIGGRRRIVFKAQIPAYGYAIYRVAEKEPTTACCLGMEIMNADPFVLENDYIRIGFSPKSGMLNQLIDKTTGYNALSGKTSFQLYTDQRDSWGGMQDRPFENRNITFVLESIEKVESGNIREVVRVRSRFEGTSIEHLYILEAESHEVLIQTRLHFAHPWSLLKFVCTIDGDCCDVSTETAYGIQQRHIMDRDEYSMQRFLDAQNSKGQGLAIANDGKYAFNLESERLGITIARSAIYAQGNSKGWYNDKESYQYHDMGEQEFRLILKPHGTPLPKSELYRIAEKAGGAYCYLADSIHAGKDKITINSLVSVDQDNICIVALKKAEDDQDTIIRLLETEGRETALTFCCFGRPYTVNLGPYAIGTYKINLTSAVVKPVNLIEWEQ